MGTTVTDSIQKTNAACLPPVVGWLTALPRAVGILALLATT